MLQVVQESSVVQINLSLTCSLIAVSNPSPVKSVAESSHASPTIMNTSGATRETTLITVPSAKRDSSVQSYLRSISVLREVKMLYIKGFSDLVELNESPDDQER